MQWSLTKNSDVIVKIHLKAIFADTIVRSSKDHETKVVLLRFLSAGPIGDDGH